MKFIHYLLCVALGSGMSLLAGPAFPGNIKIRQPDGSTIQAQLRGDEFQHWIETLDGFTIVKNTQSGVWEYGMLGSQGSALRPSGHPVHSQIQAPSFLERHLKPAQNIKSENRHINYRQQMQKERTSVPQQGPGLAQPTEMAAISGTRKLLIIRVNFSDRALTTTAANWDATVFQTGPGIKSVRQFYLDNSFGMLNILPVSHTQPGAPAGIVTVTLTTAHPNDGDGGDETFGPEVVWLNAALAQAAASVDFESLDTNGDGVITTDEAVFYFIPAGYERSCSTQTPNVWAHASDGHLTAGSRTIPIWAMNGELNYNDHQHPMGVIAHELGHSLAGLPDLYDTNYLNNGLGSFSLMASGSWGSDTNEEPGTTPVALDAWSRQYLGWARPLTPTTGGNSISLGTCLSDPTAAVRLQNSALSTQEYFLVENRFPTGWDRGLNRELEPSWGGLLVLHVDESISDNDFVKGNHQKVMAEHADNAAYGSGGTAKSLFFTGGSSNRFTPTDLPTSAYYSTISSHIGFTSASVPGKTMTFHLDTVRDPTAITLDHTTATVVSGCTLTLIGTTSVGTILWTLPKDQGSLSVSSTTSGSPNTYTAPPHLLMDGTTSVTLTNATNPDQTATSTLTIKTLDINRDSIFDLQDILALSRDWDTAATRSRLSGGSLVGETDLNLLLTSLGF